MNTKITKINLISKRKTDAILNSFLGKLTLFSSLIVLLILVHFLPTPAFAATYQVMITQGSGAAHSCITASNCYDPNNIQIVVGDTVTWTNQDSVGHTVTSGQPIDNQTGTIFDSSLIASGGSYSFTFTQAGIYNYFDMAYPYMTGTITVLTPVTVPTPSISPNNPQSSSQTEISYNIPQWVKNTAKWWADGQISESEFVKAIQYLIDNKILTGNQIINEINQLQSQNQDIRQAAMQTTNEINQLQQENNNLRTENENLKLQIHYDNEYLKQYQANVTNALQQYQANVTNTVQRLECLPLTTIRNQTIDWHFCDSKGNQYDWTYPMTGYDAIVRQSIDVPIYALQLPNGQSVTAYDYTQFANTISQNHDFSKVVDQIYDNAGSNEQFIYEISYVVSEMTTYNKDITNYNLWPLEVLTRGEGDCKDKAILMADMLRSSTHTSDWKIDLVILDLDHPTDPQAANHMIVYVDSGTQKYYVESTATPDINALNVWAGIDLYGWHIPFGNSH